ncbi:MAG: AraC family transcriptional regulator [Pseudomonadota bacterium]
MSESALKLAQWRGRLVDTRTTVRTDYHTICYHRTGSAVARLDTRNRQLTPGTAFIQPGHDEGHFESSGTLDYYHLYLKVSRFEELAQEFKNPPANSPELPAMFGCEDKLFNGIVKNCITSLTAAERPSPLELDCWANTLGVALLRFTAQNKAGHARELHKPELTPAQLGHLVDYIEENLASRMTLETMAELCGLGQYQLIRSFKFETGFSPHQYVLERRVERAREMLERPENSIAEVAYSVGFSSQAHMTDVFRRRLGVTPGAYRKDRGA